MFRLMATERDVLRSQFVISTQAVRLTRERDQFLRVSVEIQVDTQVFPPSADTAQS